MIQVILIAIFIRRSYQITIEHLFIKLVEQLKHKTDFLDTNVINVSLCQG